MGKLTWEDGRVPTFARYVALGDSQTEGLNDPDGVGGFRGWADRFAEFVALSSPGLRYANLAVRGLLVRGIRTTQLETSLALEPDLATVMGGMNDMLRPSFDVDAVVGDLDAMLAALTAAGAVTLTCTFPDAAELAPLFRRLAPRMRAYNAGIRAVAAARGALVVDFARHGIGGDPRLWSADRIHANPVGHSLMAAAFAHTVGLPGFDEGWTAPRPRGGRPRALGRATTDLRWVGATVLPWALRRARGRSSGDGRSAKRAELTAVRTVARTPIFHLVAPDVWAEAVAAGAYRPASIAAEGFVHFSFGDQVAATANLRYRDEPRLVVVEVDPSRVGAELKVEDSYGSGTEFPHVYGPIPPTAAVAIHPLDRGADGSWTFNPGGEAAAASPDR